MSISGLALSRVSHQAFGALEAAYVFVCLGVCAGHMHFYLRPPILHTSLSPWIAVTLTRACPEGAGL